MIPNLKNYKIFSGPQSQNIMGKSKIV